jgi:hypothetical protein
MPLRRAFHDAEGDGRPFFGGGVAASLPMAHRVCNRRAVVGARVECSGTGG